MNSPLQHNEVNPIITQTPTDRPQGFGQFFKENHQILGIIFLYDISYIRALRATILLLCFALQMTITCYFAEELSALSIIIIALVVSIADQFLDNIMGSFFRSAMMAAKAVGAFLTLALFTILIYFLCDVFIKADSLEETNIWAIQFSINFGVEYLLMLPIQISIRYLATIKK